VLSVIFSVFATLSKSIENLLRILPTLGMDGLRLQGCCYCTLLRPLRLCQHFMLLSEMRHSVSCIMQVDANLAAAGFDLADFDAIVAADKFEAIKPAPDIFLAAARLMGTAPDLCVVVEDAPAGILAARNAGVISVQAGMGSSSIEWYFFIFELALSVPEAMATVRVEARFTPCVQQLPGPSHISLGADRLDGNVAAHLQV